MDMKASTSLSGDMKKTKCFLQECLGGLYMRGSIYEGVYIGGGYTVSDSLFCSGFGNPIFFTALQRTFFHRQHCNTSYTRYHSSVGANGYSVPLRFLDSCYLESPSSWRFFQAPQLALRTSNLRVDLLISRYIQVNSSVK